RHAHICVRNILKLKQTRAYMRTQHMEVETHTRTYAYSTYRKSSNKDRDSIRGRASDSSRGRGRYRQTKAMPRIQAGGKKKVPVAYFTVAYQHQCSTKQTAQFN